jgi:hypothetical protein
MYTGKTLTFESNSLDCGNIKGTNMTYVGGGQFVGELMLYETVWSSFDVFSCGGSIDSGALSQTYDANSTASIVCTLVDGVPLYNLHIVTMDQGSPSCTSTTPFVLTAINSDTCTPGMPPDPDSGFPGTSNRSVTVNTYSGSCFNIIGESKNCNSQHYNGECVTDSNSIPGYSYSKLTLVIA